MSNSLVHALLSPVLECIAFMFLLPWTTQMGKEFITRFIEKDTWVVCAS